MLKDLLELTDVAETLGTDLPTVLEFTRLGWIPEPLTIGGRLVRWPTAAFVRWVEGGCECGCSMTADVFRAMRENIAVEATMRTVARVVKHHNEEIKPRLEKLRQKSKEARTP